MAQIIEMPKLSDTMTVGTLVSWLKKEGDAVAPGDMIAEVETDKATMELENFEEGTILKRYVQEGDQVPIGAPICAVGEKGEEAPEPEGSSGGSEEKEEKDSGEKKKSSKKEDASEKQESKKQKRESEAGSDGEGSERRAESPDEEDDSEPVKTPQPAVDLSNGKKGGRIKVSPVARKIAIEKGIDLREVAGTGPHGRIVKADVLQAVSGGRKAQGSSGKGESRQVPHPAYVAPDGAAVQEDESVKVSNMRATIARRLVESKQEVPHFYLEAEIDAAPLLKLRKDLNAMLADLGPEQGGVKLTVNDFILKASAEALRRVPKMNCSWQGDTIQRHGAVHLAFGVAVEEGLLTPVIRDAQAKGLRQISAEAKELIGKARNKKLKPEDMSGSTFTVTNLGMYGITNFYGIINPPNAGILSVGATIKKPVVNEKDEIVPGERMAIGLSGDHRVVDGATGAQFLAALSDILETPAIMLV